MTDTTTPEKTPIPELVAFFAEKDKRLAAFNEHGKVYQAARRENDRLYAELHKVDDLSIFAESSDPLVAWIGKNCRDYAEYAVEVLKILPATREEIEEIGTVNGWCSTWGRFVERADAAGVLPASTVSAEWRDLRSWIAAQYGTAPEANRRIKAVVAAERALAVEEYKAQQQANTEA